MISIEDYHPVDPVVPSKVVVTESESGDRAHRPDHERAIRWCGDRRTTDWKVVRKNPSVAAVSSHVRNGFAAALAATAADSDSRVEYVGDGHADGSRLDVSEWEELEASEPLPLGSVSRESVETYTLCEACFLAGCETVDELRRHSHSRLAELRAGVYARVRGVETTGGRRGAKSILAPAPPLKLRQQENSQILHTRARGTEQCREPRGGWYESTILASRSRNR
jgi:hypothetical protein